jgi:hypothetical protein
MAQLAAGSAIDDVVDMLNPERQRRGAKALSWTSLTPKTRST